MTDTKFLLQAKEAQNLNLSSLIPKLEAEKVALKKEIAERPSPLQDEEVVEVISSLNADMLLMKAELKVS